MEQKKTYEGMMKEWIETYKYCMTFEDQIKAGLIEDAEIEDYLKEKARLIVCLGNLFAIKSVEDKQAYDKEYIGELFANVKVQMEEQETKLTDFDNAYIDEMINEMEKDFIQAESEEEEVPEMMTAAIVDAEIVEPACEGCKKECCDCNKEE